MRSKNGHPFNFKSLMRRISETRSNRVSNRNINPPISSTSSYASSSAVLHRSQNSNHITSPWTRTLNRPIQPSVPPLTRIHFYPRTFSSTSSSSASYRRFGQGDGNPQSPMNTLTKTLPPSLQGSPIILILIGIGGGYYIVHLEKEQHTGRWRFLDVTRAQELSMGKQSYLQTLEEYRGRILSRNDPRTQMVEKVCSRLISAIDPKDLDTKTDWKVFVIQDDEQKNAFVVPGGKIFVFTGILGVCRDQDGLATVLGHEIAHQLARHIIGLDPGISSMAGNLLLSLPNSRKVEMEADYIGLDLMSKACYNPSQATQLWKRMEALEGASSSLGDTVKSVLSTHPVNRKRIENIEKWLPSAMQTRAAAGCRPNEVKAFSSFGNRLGI